LSAVDVVSPMLHYVNLHASLTFLLYLIFMC